MTDYSQTGYYLCERETIDLSYIFHLTTAARITIFSLLWIWLKVFTKKFFNWWKTIKIFFFYVIYTQIDNWCYHDF